jgi:hypothetical protein
MAALRLEDDYFTLDLVFPNHNSKKKSCLSQAVRGHFPIPGASGADFVGECFSGEVITLSAGRLGHYEAVALVPPVEVLPSDEVVSYVEVPPSVEIVVPAVPTAKVPHVEVPPSVEMSAMEVPSVGVPQSTESVSEVASGADKASEDGGSAALKNFVNNVTKDIPSPRLDKPPPRASS